MDVFDCLHAIFCEQKRIERKRATRATNNNGRYEKIIMKKRTAFKNCFHSDISCSCFCLRCWVFAKRKHREMNNIPVHTYWQKKKTRKQEKRKLLPQSHSLF